MAINRTRLLRSKDVAHILDCSPDDVVELVHRGRLTATKQGRFWRYSPEDVVVYKRKRDLDEVKYPPLAD